MLSGRRAVVTGGANGIGRAIVERVAADGAMVAALDVEPVPDLGASVTGFEFDLTQTERLEELLDEVDARIGPLAVLVNNAGIYEPMAAVELTLESYRRVLAVNLDGRYAEPHEIAAHVAWLASDRNTYVTGQVLTVDGGVTVTF